MNKLSQIVFAAATVAPGFMLSGQQAIREPQAQTAPASISENAVALRMSERLLKTYPADGAALASVPVAAPGGKMPDDEKAKEDVYRAHFMKAFSTILADPEVEMLVLKAEQDKTGRYIPALARKIQEKHSGWVNENYSSGRMRTFTEVSVDNLSRQMGMSGIKVTPPQRDAAINAAALDKLADPWLYADLAVTTGQNEDGVNFHLFRLNSIFLPPIVKGLNLETNITPAPGESAAGITPAPSSGPPDSPEDLPPRMAGGMYRSYIVLADTEMKSLTPALFGRESLPEKMEDRRNMYIDFFIKIYTDLAASPESRALLLRLEKDPVKNIDAVGDRLQQANPEWIDKLYGVERARTLVRRALETIPHTDADADALLQAIIKDKDTFQNLQIKVDLTSASGAPLDAIVERAAGFSQYFQRILIQVMNAPRRSNQVVDSGMRPNDLAMN